MSVVQFSDSKLFHDISVGYVSDVCISFSMDSSLFAITRDDEKSVEVCEVDSKRVMACILNDPEGHWNIKRFHAFLRTRACNNLFVGSSSCDFIHEYSAQGEVLRHVHLTSPAAAVDADDRYIVVALACQKVKVLSYADGQCLHNLGGYERWNAAKGLSFNVVKVHLMGNGMLLYHQFKRLSVYNITTGEKVSVCDLDFVSDSSALMDDTALFLKAGRVLMLVELPSLEIVESVTQTSFSYDIAFNNDHSLIVHRMCGLWGCDVWRKRLQSSFLRACV